MFNCDDSPAQKIPHLGNFLMYIHFSLFEWGVRVCVSMYVCVLITG